MNNDFQDTGHRQWITDIPKRMQTNGVISKISLYWDKENLLPWDNFLGGEYTESLADSLNWGDELQGLERQNTARVLRERYQRQGLQRQSWRGSSSHI